MSRASSGEKEATKPRSREQFSSSKTISRIVFSLVVDRRHFENKILERERESVSRKEEFHGFILVLIPETKLTDIRSTNR